MLSRIFRKRLSRGAEVVTPWATECKFRFLLVAFSKDSLFAFSWSWIFFPVPSALGCPCSHAGGSVVHILRSSQHTAPHDQSRDFLVVFPLQHHAAIPRSGVSKELYNFNASVWRVAEHLKEQCWAGFGRFAGSKLGWVRISAWIINPSQKCYLRLGCQSRFCWILIFPVTYTSPPCPVMISSALWNDTTFLSLASCGSVNMLNLSSHSRVFSALQQSVCNLVTPRGLIFQHPARVNKLALEQLLVKGKWHMTHPVKQSTE